VMTTGKIEALAIEVDGIASAATTGLVGVRRNIPLDAARLREAAAGQLPSR
jgi:cytoskeleton protein RodZ